MLCVSALGVSIGRIRPPKMLHRPPPGKRRAAALASGIGSECWQDLMEEIERLKLGGLRCRRD